MELFLLILFFTGIIIASFQDFKKREVDNWINFFLLISGASFILFKSILLSSLDIIFLGLFCFILCFAVANAFYYGRVFAGGDAKLLIALFPLFIGLNIRGSLINFLEFILFLMVAGSVWGIAYSLFFYARDFKKINKQFVIEFKNKYLRFGLIFGIAFFIISYFNFIWLLLSIFLFFICILLAFGKSIEKVSMIKKIMPSELREGDWLAEDIQIKKQTISYNWEGLTKKQIAIISKLKNKIKIKDGIAFVPAFFIAFFIYLFKEQIVQFILSFIFG